MATTGAPARAAQRSGRGPARPWASVAALAGMAAVTVAPAAWWGTGFYMDDWRDLSRMQTVGVLRSSEASRFASRPGAWVVETITYGLLRAHPLLWLVLLTVVATATATCLWLLLARYVRPNLALLVAAVWLLLPDHQSLRLFANVTPIAVSLLLLLMGLLLFEHEWPVPATLALCMGISAYESAYLPAVAGVLALHLLGHRGSRRDVGVAVGLCSVVVALMAVHPTYPLSSAHFGMPADIVVGQFTTALTPGGFVAALLGVVLVVAATLAIVASVRAGRIAGEGPQLMVGGVAVIVVGLAGYVMRAPDGVRGFADRSYGVSSIGTALLWTGAILVLARPRAVRIGVFAAFAIVLAAANVAYQRDWSTVTDRTDRALRAIDARYDGHPPSHLVVGPTPIDAHGIRSLHDFYIEDATLVTVGRSFRVTISETRAEWDATPADRRIAWAELLGEP